jgi:transposase
MVEAMLWILRTGAPWRDLPSAYGPWMSVYTRLSRGSQSGVLARRFEALARERDAEGFLIDATIVRAHQDAAGAAKKGGPKKSGARAEVRLRRSTLSSTHWVIPSASRCHRDRRTR